MITTLNGQNVTVSIMEGKVYINEAMVTTADIVTDNGVVHVIDAVLLPSTDVSQYNIDPVSITMFPNPARDFVNIDFMLSEPGSYEISLFDISGQLHRSIQRDFGYEGRQTEEISLENLKAGLYILSISNGNERHAKKLRIM